MTNRIVGTMGGIICIDEEGNQKIYPNKVEYKGNTRIITPDWNSIPGCSHNPSKIQKEESWHEKMKREEDEIDKQEQDRFDRLINESKKMNTEFEKELDEKINRKREGDKMRENDNRENEKGNNFLTLGNGESGKTRHFTLGNINFIQCHTYTEGEGNRHSTAKILENDNDISRTGSEFNFAVVNGMKFKTQEDYNKWKNK